MKADQEYQAAFKAWKRHRAAGLRWHAKVQDTTEATPLRLAQSLDERWQYHVVKAAEARLTMMSAAQRAVT